VAFCATSPSCLVEHLGERLLAARARRRNEESYWLQPHAAGTLILLRFVTKGKKGAIRYLVKIDIKARPVISRWTIESGTKAYKGLQGKGTETENATWTVSTLRGTVWR
jgi:hypothetical protein